MEGDADAEIEAGEKSNLLLLDSVEITSKARHDHRVRRAEVKSEELQAVETLEKRQRLLCRDVCLDDLRDVCMA